MAVNPFATRVGEILREMKKSKGKAKDRAEASRRFTEAAHRARVDLGIPRRKSQSPARQEKAAAKKASPAQVRARKRFAAMARSRRGSRTLHRGAGGHVMNNRVSHPLLAFVPAADVAKGNINVDVATFNVRSARSDSGFLQMTGRPTSRALARAPMGAIPVPLFDEMLHGQA